MRNLKEILDDKLNELMSKYECDDPLEALVVYYFTDHGIKIMREIEQRGGDIEEELEKLAREVEMSDMNCITDPDKAAVHNKVLLLINEYYKKIKEI